MCRILSSISIAVLLLSVLAGYIFKLYSLHTETTMVHTGLLFVSNLTKAQAILVQASKYVQKVLYISVTGTSESVLPSFSKHLVQIYSKSTSVCGNLDVRLLLKPGPSLTKISTNHPVDMVLYDGLLAKEITNLKQRVTSLTDGHQMMGLDLSQETSQQLQSSTVLKKYDYVALGGTFDRLHNGHKILLSEAALRTEKQLTVGVTDVDMLQSKKLWELIEPLEDRISSVRNFLNDVNPDIEYNVVPLHDIYGPTAFDSKLQLLVVSEETARGGVKVNEKRKENNLPTMDIYTIELAEDSVQSSEEETKVSSSNRRMRLLGTLLKNPVHNPNIPDLPYVIGLSGGIASGKTKIAERLKKRGAAVLDCDILAHELYKPGLPLNGTIAETFGADVILESGEVNRKRLGEIVFKDKGELEKLNQILWPAIINEAQNRTRALGQQGYSVVVMEAAVLLRAGWDRYCHQLWAVIVPPEEAIVRLKQRNGLAEEAARERIAAQVSNQEQVARANVVFSPYWSYDYTQEQVDRAWEQLQEHLKTRHVTVASSK